MTPDQMRDAIEAVYAERILAAGHTFPVELQEGATPLGWHFTFHENVQEYSPDQFEPMAVMCGSQLAGDGFRHGCTVFARLTVRDRPAAQVKGHMKVHKRPRVFVVHALGWKG